MRATVSTAFTAVAFGGVSAHAQPPIPTWKLAPAPSVTIEGDGPAEFHRITGIVRLSTGHIAVVNAGTNEVRVFSSTGSHVSTFGRDGSGPGEFRGPAYVWRAGDTVMIDDSSLLRLTSLLGGAEMKLLRIVPMTARSERNVYGLRGRTHDGKWLAFTNGAFQWEGPSGVRRTKASVGFVPHDGSGTVQWIAEIPSSAYRLYNPTGDIKKGASMGTIPFTPWAFATTTTTHAWFGDSSTDTLVAVRGSERRSVRLPLPARKTSSADMATYRAQALARARTDEARAAVKRLTTDQFPRQLPTYDALIPGSDGDLWVQVFAVTNSVATRYLVVGSDLKPKAWIPVPAGFRVKDVGRDYVAGVHFDEDEVETVRVYQLSR